MQYKLLKIRSGRSEKRLRSGRQRLAKCKGKDKVAALRATEHSANAQAEKATKRKRDRKGKKIVVESPSDDEVSNDNMYDDSSD